MKIKESVSKRKRADYKTVHIGSALASSRRIFRHGGSYAVHIPMSFAKRIGCENILIEETSGGLFIHSATKLDTMENDPSFDKFIQAIYADALANPHKLHDMKEVWDEKTVAILKDVKPFDE